MKGQIELKQFDIMSVAKIAALFGIVFGLFTGIFIAALGGAGLATLGIDLNLGYLAIIVMPIVYAIIYFIMGAVYAIIYNFLAKKIGGIKVKI